MVKYISDRVGVMYLGRLVEIAAAEELFAHPLHPYTQALLSSVPIPDPRAERARVELTPEGELPEPLRRHPRLRLPRPLPARPRSLPHPPPRAHRGRPRPPGDVHPARHALGLMPPRFEVKSLENRLVGRLRGKPLKRLRFLPESVESAWNPACHFLRFRKGFGLG